MIRSTHISGETRSPTLSHLSIDLGEFGIEELESPRELETHFDKARTLAQIAIRDAEQEYGMKHPQLLTSTCVLLRDDREMTARTPEHTIGNMLSAAAKAGVEIDYIGRQSAMTEPIDDSLITPADIASGRLFEVPTPGTNGSQAMNLSREWVKVEWPLSTDSLPEDAPWEDRYEIREVQLYKDKKPTNELLAAVWCLLRHSMLQHEDTRAISSRFMSLNQTKKGRFGHTWQIPGLMKLRKSARPFDAYSTLTVRESESSATQSTAPILELFVIPGVDEYSNTLSTPVFQERQSYHFTSEIT